MVLSVVSLVFASVALVVTLTGLRRRPRIVSKWGYVQEDPQPYEGISVIVTGRRRAIEVDEIGMVVMPRTWRRRVPEWTHADKPFRVALSGGRAGPKTLTDGSSVRAFSELDAAIDDLHGHDGRMYVYVQASGVTYLVRDSKVRNWFRSKLEPNYD